ncbi:PaaI family thioesterase [Dactylosporangium sp. CS-033363]|uniref:PaaI family thioesterase n=1 Tax=Dactylosporangium sp. CS-033363 TaxID=3239935 RepID=UPI003D926C55
MDATELARRLLAPIPAHLTLGLEVLRAADGSAEVAAEVPEALTNVIGSLHSSGLITLIDAAGLAALIAAVSDPAGFEGVVPLGAAADLRFLAPARGRLTASCHLAEAERASAAAVFNGTAKSARVTTAAEVRDESGRLVCEGSFHWSLRRR